jgi:hypothetical protein
MLTRSIAACPIRRSGDYITKSFFKMHGVDVPGQVVLRRQLNDGSCLSAVSSINAHLAIPAHGVYFRCDRDLRCRKDLTMPILENPRHEAFAQ